MGTPLEHPLPSIFYGLCYPHWSGLPEYIYFWGSETYRSRDISAKKIICETEKYLQTQEYQEKNEYQEKKLKYQKKN